jgi:hypothetical protein
MDMLEERLIAITRSKALGRISFILVYIIIVFGDSEAIPVLSILCSFVGPPFVALTFLAIFI